MKQILKQVKRISVLLLAISFFGGCADDDELVANVTAKFTYTISDSRNVTFINVSENANSYTWDFGDENNSIEINPLKTYPEDGEYLVTLKATNSAGHMDVFTDTIVIGQEVVQGPIVLPITFDADNVNYMATTFNGATYEIVENPSLTGTNSEASNVFAITNSGAEYEGVYFDLGTPVDLTTGNTITLNFWSETAIDVLMKLEEGDLNTEIIASHGGTGWETLSFIFDSSESFSRVTLFVDGAGTTAGTFYIDDIEQTVTTAPTACTSETVQSISASDLNITFMSDVTMTQDGTTHERIDNPDFENSVNTSCFVSKITNLGQNPWDNVQIDLDAKLDFNANSGLKLKVYSAQSGYKVTVKLEDQSNSGINTEIGVTTTMTNGWEELTFPFSTNETNKYDKIVLFFDLESTNANTYYFDDLTLVASGGGGGTGSGSFTLSDTIDFEASGFGASWAWNVFENDTNPALEFVSNPSASGINTSATVAKITALQAGQPYVGTETAHGEMGITWDLSATNAVIKIMVYKTVISDVGIKLVNPAGGAQEEIKVANTVINQWEELTFDFSSRIGNGLDGSTNIDQIVVFPDFNLDGRTSDNVVYFDNITFSGN